MDVKQKQRAVIELLLLEGLVGQEIAIHLCDVYGEAAYSRVPIFQSINWVCSGDAGF
jgi:hypothetical protein